MNVLGIQGCYSRFDEEFIPGLPRWFFHDSAAVLAIDGRIVAACEEERLNRIKHTNKFPVRAVEFCLETARISRSDLKKVAVPWTEEFCDEELLLQYIEHPSVPVISARSLTAERLGISPSAIHFVDHHRAHAYAALHNSGFDRCLIVVVDGQAERQAITVYEGGPQGIQPLKTYPIAQSIGFFYRAGTRLLGYDLFDEYKVMGMAPYGDPQRYLSQLEDLLSLEPQGDFSLDVGALSTSFLRASGYVPRRKGSPFSVDHYDLAAGIQVLLERIMYHVVNFWQKQTNAANLCLVGGAAHNCASNGNLARKIEAERIFVHPASHDAGAALGAALAVSAEVCGVPLANERLQNAFYGTHVGSHEQIRRELHKWRDVVSFQHSSEIYQDTAALLAEGKVVGWVQGRSEFGPRALGHRSILADPRPASNKDRINKMVKKREAYRPFAPAVLEEYVREFFDLGTASEARDYEFMTVVGMVHPDKRELLGATTHVDGSARVQTVNQDRNPHFWKLIRAFQSKTSVPVLLNTSFNNHAEPIVDSAADAVQSFLTTELDVLVVGNWIVEKKRNAGQSLLKYTLTIPGYMRLERVARWSSDGCRVEKYQLRREVNEGRIYPVSRNLHEILERYNGSCVLEDLMGADISIERRSELLDEVVGLWQERVIILSPVA